MATVHVLDDYYLAITALVTIAYQLFFAIAYSLQFDKLTDLAGDFNFAVLDILTLAMSGRHHARQVVASVFLIVWAVRLAGFLFYRILRTGSDDRFDGKRDRFAAFLGFWLFQMLWVWAVSLPVTVLNSPNVTRYAQHDFGTGRDIAGVILFVLGFLMEAISDKQKYHFRKNHDKKDVCNKGLFAISRHPNYFGEILIQFSIYIDSRLLRRRRLRARPDLQRPLCHHSRSRAPDPAAHVHLGPATVGAAQGQDAVRKRQQLGRVQALARPHQHPHPLSAPAVCPPARLPQTHPLARVPHVRLRPC